MHRSHRTAKWIDRGLRRLERWMLGPAAGGLPERGIHTIEEARHREDVARHVEESRLVDGATVREYAFPEGYPPYFRRQKAFDRRYVYLLSDVIASPRSGVVRLPNGRVLQESVGSLNRILGWGDARPELAVEPRRIPEQVGTAPVVIAPATGASYFHWLFESLPAVRQLMEERDDARLLVPDGSPDYALESLREVVGGQALSQAIRADRSLRVSRLLLRTHLPYSGFVHPRDLESLRGLRADASYDDSTRSAGDRIYVSRRHADRRAYDSEGRLEEILASEGFAAVTCEALSFRRQVARFREAGVIVGPHGAGLANMVWADRPCRVIELFPPGVFNDCYARLARELDFEYAHVMTPASVTEAAEAVLSLVDDRG